MKVVRCLHPKILVFLQKDFVTLPPDPHVSKINLSKSRPIYTGLDGTVTKHKSQDGFGLLGWNERIQAGIG